MDRLRVTLIPAAVRTACSDLVEWRSFHFKSPMAAPGLTPEHDLFTQQTKRKNTLRWLRGQAPITHLGTEYYED